MLQQLWTDIGDKDISCFTSDMKEAINEEAGVLITTYSMISFAGQRSEITKRILDSIKGREWGFMLLDEVRLPPRILPFRFSSIPYCRVSWFVCPSIGSHAIDFRVIL